MKKLASVFLSIFFVLHTNMHGQLLQLSNSNFNMQARVLANDFIVPNGPGQDPVVIFDSEDCTENRQLIAGFLGNDYGYWCHAEALESAAFPYSTTRSGANGYVYVNGDNSSTVTITWDFGAQGYTCSKEGYFATASNLALASLTFDIVSAPANQLVNIYFQYTAFSGIGTDHEGANEDEARALDSLFLVGTELFEDANINMSFESPPGASGWNHILGKSGVINATVGMPINAAIEADLFAMIDHPAKPCQRDDSLDLSNAHFRGELILSIAPIVYPSAYVLTPNELGLFSVDIGSDGEISDMNSPNNNVFDPGDAYEINGAMMTFPGRDGIIDDSTFLGTDIAPSHPTNGAPVLSGIAPDLIASAYHDIDGIDLLANKLTGVSNRVNSANQPCLKSIRHLFVSYDDDTPEHYTNGLPSLPNMSSSSGLDTIFGNTLTKDEVLQLDFTIMPPYSSVFEFPIWSESDIHPNLIPNPDGAQFLDDDVDALDISEGLSTCPIIFFSVDHEATGSTGVIPMLNPGVIYEYDNLGILTAVIDPVIDLGLPLGVDIDAFEFVLIPDSNNVSVSRQALVFSVDNDDPLTLADESGGLQPNVLYASYYDGSGFFALGNGQGFRDDIDAITAWATPLTGVQPIIPTGLKLYEFNDAQHVQVYPNPVDINSILRIKSLHNNEYDIAISNSAGQIIARKRVSDDLVSNGQMNLKDVINFKKLSKGIYQIHLLEGDKIVGAGKFIY